MMDDQMELSLGNATACRSLERRRRRVSRARWWFERMRQVVDRAILWQPAPPPRPEQIWFPGAQRPLAAMPGPAALGGNSNPEERQICE